MKIDDNGGWGAKVFLTAGVHIPQWITQHHGVTTQRGEKNGTPYILLDIPDGHAMFQGGVVKVTVGRNNDGYRMAFREPTDVLEIRDRNGHLLKDNHRLCHTCFMNTKDHQPMPCGQGRYNVHFFCAKCDRRWSKWSIEWIFHVAPQISGS